MLPHSSEAVGIEELASDAPVRTLKLYYSLGSKVENEVQPFFC